MYVTLDELCGCEVHCSDGRFGKVRTSSCPVAWRCYAVVNLGPELKNAASSPLDGDGRADVCAIASTSLTRRQLRWAPPYDAARSLTRRQEALLAKRCGWPPEWLLEAPHAEPVPVPLDSKRPVTDTEHTLEQMLCDEPETQSASRMIAAFTAFTSDRQVASVETLIVNTENWQIPCLVLTLAAAPRPVMLSARNVEAIDWLHKHIYLAETAEQIRRKPKYNQQAAARFDAIRRLTASSAEAAASALLNTPPGDRLTSRLARTNITQPRIGAYKMNRPEHAQLQQRSPEQLQQLSLEMSKRIIEITTRAGSGHPSSSLSAIDILACLYLRPIMRYDPHYPDWTDRDRFIMSKGHPPVCHGPRRFFRPTYSQPPRTDSPLEGYPNMPARPRISTGSLGQGLHRHRPRPAKIDPYAVYVAWRRRVQEGQIWKASCSPPAATRQHHRNHRPQPVPADQRRQNVMPTLYPWLPSGAIRLARSGNRRPRHRHPPHLRRTRRPRQAQNDRRLAPEQGLSSFGRHTKQKTWQASRRDAPPP